MLGILVAVNSWPAQVYAQPKQTETRLVFDTSNKPDLPQKQIVVPVPPPPPPPVKPVVKKANLAKNKSVNRWGRYDCVKFVKDMLGIYVKFGNGGRALSHNSDGQVGDVAIFRNYVHAGLVIDRQGDQVTIREWITTKTAAYEQVRTLDTSAFLGFHSF